VSKNLLETEGDAILILRLTRGSWNYISTLKGIVRLPPTVWYPARLHPAMIQSGTENKSTLVVELVQHVTGT
jgi:hypothetical protein